MNLTREGLIEELTCKRDIVKLSTGTVTVKEYSALEHMKISKMCATNDYEKEGIIKIDRDKFNAAQIVYCVIDPETGERIFKDEDIPFIMESSSKTFVKIIEAIQKLNGMTGEEGNDSEPIQDGSNSGE